MKTRRCVACLAVVIILVYTISCFTIKRIHLYGDSMEPAFSEGDILLMNTKFREIHRFDVIAFRYLYQDEDYYVKRVIGLPGETVQIIDGNVWVDGTLLEGDYGWEPIEKPRRAKDPVLLGDDEYFVLGDNRNDSSDSRDSDIANVSESQVVGRIILRISRGEKDRTYEKIE